MAKEEDDETAIEVQDLQDEADMPIEQLLARYGYASSKAQPMDVDPTASEPLAKEAILVSGNGTTADPQPGKSNPAKFAESESDPKKNDGPSTADEPAPVDPTGNLYPSLIYRQPGRVVTQAWTILSGHRNE